MAGECGDERLSSLFIPSEAGQTAPMIIARNVIGAGILFALLVSIILCFVMQRKLRKMAPEPPCMGMSLSFSGIGYQVAGKQVLDSVDGVANPGRVLAILGPSGIMPVFLFV